MNQNTHPSAIPIDLDNNTSPRLAVPTHGDALLTPPQQLAVDAKMLARLLCCSQRHIERQDASGQLPAPVRIGRAKRWRVSEIEAWLVAGCPDRQTWNATKGGSP